MRAITVQPGTANTVRLEEVADCSPESRLALVRTLAIGVCGTDVEIVRGAYGWAPRGQSRLVLGHESLGEVVTAPTSTDLAPGDLVVGIVRRPDPLPCANCARGEWDMCRNGGYTEHGIKALDGFAREQYGIDPSALVKVDRRLGLVGVLLEPTSVVAKAWEQIERIGQRAFWQPQRVLVTGAGPIGLLAALLSVHRGLEVHVLDRWEEGLKPRLVKALGAHYHTGSLHDAVRQVDVVVECTGVGDVVFEAMHILGADGILCLTGLSSGGHRISVDVTNLNRQFVLENAVIVGAVNANRRHYEQAARALAQADPHWLAQLVTRRVKLTDWEQAFRREPDDIKTVIGFP